MLQLCSVVVPYLLLLILFMDALVLCVWSYELLLRLGLF